MWGMRRAGSRPHALYLIRFMYICKSRRWKRPHSWYSSVALYDEKVLISSDSDDAGWSAPGIFARARVSASRTE